MKYLTDLPAIDNYVYLASPYSDDVYTMQVLRYELAKRALALTHESGFIVYSPIVHWHPAAETYQMDRSSMYWSYHNLVMLRGAEEIWVLMLLGWQESVGVAQELQWAKNFDKPVRFIYMSDLQDSILVLDE